jgi:alkylation response protein AidB-like acyl-CoA dehydrogenase
MLSGKGALAGRSVVVVDGVGDDLEAYRLRAREWLSGHVPAGWRQRVAAADRHAFLEFQREWLRALAGAGYAAPHWPKEYGGGATLAEQVVLYEEMQAAGAPGLPTFFVSLNQAAATIIGYGSDEHRCHLARILDGELWCQGFSEPDAGSDLASLRTRARRDRDRYIVNGQKVWSSFADLSDWCLLLARTDPNVPKRKGITYFLLDMSSPGVETRPIRQLTGETEFCEIFLNDVEIPLAHRIGEEGQGWVVAQATLSSERGPSVLELEAELRDVVSKLIALAGTIESDERRVAADDGYVRDTIARLYGETMILSRLCKKMIENLQRRGGVGPEASIIKLYYSELLQRLADVGGQLTGMDGQIELLSDHRVPWSSWVLEHMAAFRWTIAAGSNEIQRNLIAERVLGLPRDPLVD